MGWIYIFLIIWEIGCVSYYGLVKKQREKEKRERELRVLINYSKNNNTQKGRDK